MIARIFIGLGVFVIGYYLGRETAKVEMAGRDIPGRNKRRTGQTIDFKADNVKLDSD